MQSLLEEVKARRRQLSASWQTQGDQQREGVTKVSTRQGELQRHMYTGNQGMRTAIYQQHIGLGLGWAFCAYLHQDVFFLFGLIMHAYNSRLINPETAALAEACGVWNQPHGTRTDSHQHGKTSKRIRLP